MSRAITTDPIQLTAGPGGSSPADSLRAAAPLTLVARRGGPQRAYAGDQVVVLANARVPGYRAHSVQVVHSAAALDRCGVPVELWVPVRSGTGRAAPTAEELTAFYGVPGPRTVHRLSSVDLIDRLPLPLQRPAFLLQTATFVAAARRRLARTPWATLLVRDPHTLYLLARQRAAWLAAVVYEAHGVPQEPASRRRLAALLPQLGRVIALNRHLRDELIRLGADPGRVTVEAAAAVGDGRPLPHRDAARDELGLERSAPVVAYAGSLSEAKGVACLVAAASLLPAQWTVLVVGGDERQLRWARRLAGREPRLRLVGRVTPGRVRTYLAAADVAVLPNSAGDVAASRWTSPMKLFEAAACGRPLVLSDVPALRMAVELLPSELPIVWCRPDDPAALAAALVAAEALGAGSPVAVDDGWRWRAERLWATFPERRRP